MDELLERLLLGVPPDESPVTHVRTLTRRDGTAVPWPDWVPGLVRDRLALRGVAQPWEHQARAASLAHHGRSVVVATGTASGKSLAYQLPGLTALMSDPRARVLYLSPTKALAGDQLAALRALALPAVRAATFDGDTPTEERDWVRVHANWVLSNPDMLHRGVLPAHARWASFFRRLRYVVIDECHTYRGLFGSHVAQVLRRLRRVCARYGSQPVFVLASATVSAPEQSASRLVGLPVSAIADNASPRGASTFALWEPPLSGLHGENGAPLRRSAGAEAARILADLVVEGARTLAFVRSRRGAEFAALSATRHLNEAGLAELVPRVAAYRAGYLPEERRALEAALRSGELLGVAATNALELGLDISGLDAVVLAGYPGTLASLWQQAGRAGRRSGEDALVVFVARDDPLDTYLVHHPESVFGRPVEATVFDPENPYVLAPQLCCAAAELPLRPAELRIFSAAPDCTGEGVEAESAADAATEDGAGDGDTADADTADVAGEGRAADPATDGDTADAECSRPGGTERVRAVLDELVAAGALRKRPSGWYWTHHDRPTADIRGTGGAPVSVIEAGTGSLVGTVDAGAAHSTVHDGAVYLHQGRSYVVDHLDLDESVALAHPDAPPWSTAARDVTDIAVVGTRRTERHGPVTAALGTVDVTNQVVSYLRRNIATGEILDETPLDLPPRQLRTTAVWYSLPQDVLDDVGLEQPAVPGAAHAAEHAAIGLLPLFATCDRWDIGGVSTALHPDTGEPTVFVYDGHPGGAGFAERGYETLTEWLWATREAIAACECPAGCPSCVQSPKCGNGNDPLDKAGAIMLLDLVLGHLADV